MERIAFVHSGFKQVCLRLDSPGIVSNIAVQITQANCTLLPRMFRVSLAFWGNLGTQGKGVGKATDDNISDVLLSLSSASCLRISL